MSLEVRLVRPKGRPAVQIEGDQHLDRRLINSCKSASIAAKGKLGKSFREFEGQVHPKAPNIYRVTAVMTRRPSIAQVSSFVEGVVNDLRRRGYTVEFADA